MLSTELLQLAIALVALAGIVFLLRRASIRSRERGATARERLGVEPEARPARVRRRPRPEGTVEPATETAAAAAEAEAEAAEVEPDDETRDAFKAGLAKTRGGFVARIGKLFGKKKIDAQPSTSSRKCCSRRILVRARPNGSSNR